SNCGRRSTNTKLMSRLNSSIGPSGRRTSALKPGLRGRLLRNCYWSINVASVRLQNPKQVALWITELINRRRDDIVQAWESATSRDERERLHVALHELEALRDAIDGSLREQLAGDGRPRPE